MSQKFGEVVSIKNDSGQNRIALSGTSDDIKVFNEAGKQVAHLHKTGGRDS